MGEGRSFRRDRPGPPEGAGIDLTNFREKADFLWSLAEILRGDYKQSEYGRVILPHAVVELIGKDATWPSIPTDGAQHAAQLINELRPAMSPPEALARSEPAST